MKKLLICLSVAAAAAGLVAPLSADAAPLVTCAAHAPKPFQTPGPNVEFKGTMTCDASVEIQVTIDAYVDGDFVGGETQTCYATTACLADEFISKRWGCHNYQGHAIGQVLNWGITDDEWSAIWTGCR